MALHVLTPTSVRMLSTPASLTFSSKKPSTIITTCNRWRRQHASRRKETGQTETIASRAGGSTHQARAPYCACPSAAQVPAQACEQGQHRRVREERGIMECCSCFCICSPAHAHRIEVSKRAESSRDDDLSQFARAAPLRSIGPISALLFFLHSFRNLLFYRLLTRLGELSSQKGQRLHSYTPVLSARGAVRCRLAASACLGNNAHNPTHKRRFLATLGHSAIAQTRSTMQIVPDTDRSALLRAISVKPPTEEQKQKGWTRDWSVAWVRCAASP